MAFNRVKSRNDNDFYATFLFIAFKDANFSDESVYPFVFLTFSLSKPSP